jgi:hypothetical protein
MVLKCSTCRYRELVFSDNPCVECYGHSEWSPIRQDCSSCEHRNVGDNQPCCYCFQQGEWELKIIN